MRRFIALFLVPLLFCSGALQANATSNRIVAVVNDQVITQQALKHAIIDAQHMAKAHHQTLPRGQALRKMILNQLISQRLVLGFAQERKITVSKKDVAHFTARVAQQQKLSVAQYKAKMHKVGISGERFQKNARSVVAHQNPTIGHRATNHHH